MQTEQTNRLSNNRKVYSIHLAVMLAFFFASCGVINNDQDVMGIENSESITPDIVNSKVTQEVHDSTTVESDNSEEDHDSASKIEIVGRINGDPISREAFDATWVIPKVVSEVRGQVPPIIPKVFLLDELVNNILLLQSAKEAGVSVSEQAVQNDLTLFLASLGISSNDFETRLLEYGITWPILEENVERSLIINEYKNNYILTHVMESEREVFLNSWLMIRIEESTIEFETAFLEELYNE